MTPATLAILIERLRVGFEADDPSARWKTTERQNLGVLQNAYRAAAAGDFASFRDSFTDDTTLEIVGPPGIPFLGRWQGRNAVLAAVTANFAMIENQNPDVEQVVAQGDALVIVLRERGRFRATGVAYHVHGVQVFTFRDGKVAGLREFITDVPPG